MSTFFAGTYTDNIISTTKNLLYVLKEWNYLKCLTKTKAMFFRARYKEVDRTIGIILNNAKIDFVTKIKTWPIVSTEDLSRNYT